MAGHAASEFLKCRLLLRRGLAIPKNHIHRYIAEHHGYGARERTTEDLDPDKAWDERAQ